MHELLGVQHLGDGIGHDRTADGQVPGRQSFCHGHDVGFDAEGLRSKPISCPAKTGNHLVRDQQDAMFAADALDLCPVAIGCPNTRKIVLN